MQPASSLFAHYQALRLATCFICVAPRRTLPNDTLMTFFIRVTFASEEETQKTAMCSQPKAFALLKTWIDILLVSKSVK